MAKFILEIECDNAAFEDNGVIFEIASILAQAKKHVEDGNFSYTLYDTNGNRVGGHRYDG